MTILTWLVTNWQLLVAAIVVISAVVTWGYKFFNLSPEEKRKNIETILISLTYEAENALGAKTGSVKRSYVYSAFKKNFPFLASITPMSTFDKLLDSSLETMKNTFKQPTEENQ